MNLLFYEAVRYVREVKAAAAGDGRDIYEEFIQTLEQYRKRNIDSSGVISTVKTLFRNHPNLLDGFNHFVPHHQSAAAPAGDSCAEFLNRAALRSCLDFLNRVGGRFDGGGPYREFLECMHAHSRGEITAGGVYYTVVGLFGENDSDLLREFRRFLPDLREGEGPRKRKETDRRDELGAKRRRSSSSGREAPRPRPPVKSRSDGLKVAWRDNEMEDALCGTKRRRRSSFSGEGSLAAPPPPEKFRSGGLKKAMERDNEMEDLLCEIDVRIGRLGSAGGSVLRLYGGIGGGSVSAEGVRVEEHFTAVELACIRSVGRKLLERVDGDFLFEVMGALRKKKLALMRARVKIMHKWNKIRQSH